MAKVKSLQAKKLVNKPEDLTHKYYEPERLMAKLQKEGKSSDEIREAIISYVKEERTKCFDDPIYFANSYGFIIGHGASGIIPFSAATYQEDLLKGVRNDKYSIAVKSRQLGVSTVIMFYCLWFSIFSQGKKTLVVAHKRESAEEFISKLKTAYEFLPEWLKPACTLYSKSTVEFDTKSSIKAMTSNPNAARAFSATLFVLDEAAFIENCDEVVKAILPTVAAADAKLIAISSPNGNSDLNWFYKTYTYAAATLNTWTAYNLPYTVSPVFTKDSLFKEHQIQIDNGNVDKFEQEYECFPCGTPILTSSGSVPIEEIKLNDIVISHSGRLRKVTALNNKQYSGKLYKITSYGSGEAILCTPEHPIRTYNKSTQEYTWIAAKDLTKKDLLVFPKMSLGSFKPISIELCKLLAWYITEGSISKTSITFSVSNSLYERDRVLALLETLNLSYSTRQTTGWQIQVNDTKLADFFSNSCGSLAENKKIPFDLISGHEEVFFTELLYGDGCRSIHNGYEKYCYATISKSLAYQVQLLANSLNLGYTAGITITAPHKSIIEDRIVNCSTRYNVQIGINQNPLAKSRKLILAKNSMAAIIRKIETVDFEGVVYNFSVAYDESYIVAGRAVHNCRFDVNLLSLFNSDVLRAFKSDEKILNRQLGGITYEDTLFIWKLAEVGSRYIIGVDCSSNKSSAKDYSAFQVIDVDTQEQMAEYMGKLPTELFVEILLKTAKHYNTAELVIEENSYSQLVIYLLEQKNYKHLWMADNKQTPGFNTNRSSRVLLLEKLILFYNNLHGISKLKSARLKVQMENFSANQAYADGTRKYEASQGNDDLILALALAVVTLTPKEYFHRPDVDENASLIMSAENMVKTGEYSEEYLEHFSVLMGISKTSLASRLKLYHDIKSGTYDGSGLEDISFIHPVEEWERTQAAADFLGMKNTQILSDLEFTDLKNTTLPFGENYCLDDIFSEDNEMMRRAHQNFIYGSKARRNNNNNFW